MSVYTDRGYLSRNDYLECLADDFYVDSSVVYVLAELLGKQEDFDGLVTEIQDYVERTGGEF